jgi:tetratricopeptide (TPR) repeat protein
MWTGRPEEAQAILGRLREQYPKDTTFATEYEAARAAAEAKKVAAARQAGQTAQLEGYVRTRLAADPHDVASLRALADLITEPQRCDERIAIRQKLFDLAPRDPRAQVELARCLGECNRFEQSIERYRQFLSANPTNTGVMQELASTLRHAGRLEEAIALFRDVLRANPDSTEARLELAMALSSSGKHTEALERYDEVLQTAPDNYEALQGKASILFWTGDFKPSRAIFESLAARRPGDPLNARSIKQIDAAEEEARWAAVRPQQNGAPAEWQKYYLKRLEVYPNDMASMKGLAYVLEQAKDNRSAIDAYRKVLAAYPNDRSSQLALARLISWEGSFDEAIALYTRAINDQPDDLEALESLARVQSWAGKTAEALKSYQALLAKKPASIAYQLEVARLQLRMNDTPAAREFLTAVLSADPTNREAQLLLAQLSANQGRQDNAIRIFDALLKQNPKDSAARFGKARAQYFSGEIGPAYQVASALVKDEPDNVDALFLLATLERARSNRAAALSLLDETLKRSPTHREAAEMKRSILESGGVRLHTTTSFTRETGKLSGAVGDAALLVEDLRTFTYGTTLDFELFPRTTSSLSSTFLPSNTPFGGLRGAVGPSQFFYKQTTQVGPVAVRAGAGVVRFGSGDLVIYPGQPNQLPSARLTPVAMAGLNYTPARNVRLDVSFSRSGITYTPTSVRLGVVQNGLSGNASFTLTPRTSLFLGYDYGRFATREYDHAELLGAQPTTVRRSDSDTMHRGTIVFNRSLYRSTRFTLDAGYSGALFGNPGFSQSHLFIGRTSTRLFGPLRFNFQGGIGAQQTKGEPVRRGLQASPSFAVRVSRWFSFGVGYTYYNTAQTLSTLSGNSFYLTTDWRLQ